METTTFCTFEQKLSPSDMGKLARVIGAVIPIPQREHLISHSHIGLYKTIKSHRDFYKIRTTLRNMTLTVLRQVEGGQILLGVPVHGRLYTIRNTGPVQWEKGDTLVVYPPVTTTLQQNSIMSLPEWELVVPWIIPSSLAAEINQKLTVMGLLSLDRNYEDARAAIARLRQIQFRGTTFTLPDVVNDDNTLWDMKNICISMSMIANLATDLTLGYVRKLALEDRSMLLTKCQELLVRRVGDHHRPGENNPGRRGQLLAPEDEAAKMSTFLVMVRQVLELVMEEPAFIVCDVTPDNKSATCIFKG
ncbi:GP85 [Caviid betaherpesvirus 2]|uniref:GP85 n=2 Tax=Caviid betaherpesvirus 2 TaxID=33706 RepID=U6H8F6_9BETA|nr:GP85 [Caviid betaherpesvirus 2]AGE11556.1 GP85 [Caviid betaherpesvirus 2]AIL83944.1 GP85 [BAC cloning vector GPN13BACdenovo_preserved(MM)]BAJ78544.1 GP85 [Caviid betaherpesvirus 2]CDI95421.1 GP85 [Caviid herpesvirus 2 str. CIDMTR]